MPTQAAQPSRPSWLSSSNAWKEFWMLFATTLSFAPPLFADAGSTSAVLAPFRYQPERSTRSVTFRLCPAWIVAGEGSVASSLELGLWIWNSSAVKVPGGAATDTCCAMVVLPSGSVTSVAPVSNSSQSSFPATASQDATSERLSSTLRSTTCALRITIESLPSVISVLSPVAVTLGAAEVLDNAALGAGAAAWRAVSARLTVPILESEQAASANDSASATSVTFFILPPP